VLFVHGSGSSRFSKRNRYVAEMLNEAGFATPLADLLGLIWREHRRCCGHHGGGAARGCRERGRFAGRTYRSRRAALDALRRMLTSEREASSLVPRHGLQVRVCFARTSGI
jgi:hypothetical protein